jgi:hypothetical protein
MLLESSWLHCPYPMRAVVAVWGLHPAIAGGQSHSPGCGHYRVTDGCSWQHLIASLAGVHLCTHWPLRVFDVSTSTADLTS